MTPLRTRLYTLLRASERYLHVDMIYLARGGFWLGSAQVFSALTSLILALAFANLLPQDVYGNYRYVLSVAGVLTLFSLTGVNTAFAQSVARGYEGSYRELFVKRVQWGLIAGVASALAAAYYCYEGNANLVIPFLIGAAFLPFFDSLNIFLGFLQGRKYFRELSVYGNVEQLITTAAFVVVLFLTDNLALLVLTYFSVWTAVRVFFYLWVPRAFKPNDKRDPGVMRYGKHLSVIGFVSGIASYLDKLLVFHYVGAADLAVYTIALAPVEQVKGLFKNIPSLALPVLSHKTMPELDASLYRRILQLMAIGAACAIIYLIVAPYAYPILFPKYLASIPYSQWYALSLVLIPPVIFLGAAFQAKPELIRANYTGTVIGNAVLIASLLVFGYFYGVAGIIGARVFQYAFGIAVNLVLWKRAVRTLS